MEETNELKERLESTLITRTFNVNGMPESVWKRVDEFCKTHYGDVRWVMVKDLIEMAQLDWKYELIFEELEVLKDKVVQLEEGLHKGVNVAQKPTVKTFGSDTKVDKEIIGDRYGG
jgi:putative transposon-encoded protein